MRKQLFAAVLLFMAATAFAQRSDSLVARVAGSLDTRANKSLSATLFLHCDKTLYTNNEIIWFAAYLLGNRGVALENHHTLSVALALRESRAVVLSEYYVMEGGLSSGSISLPDTIPPGNYVLFAFTNVTDASGKPYEVFTQPLTIKTTRQSSFTASLQLLDTVASAAGTARVAVSVRGLAARKDGSYPPVKISYLTTAGASGGGETNAIGRVDLNIPLNASNISKNVLYATLRAGKDVSFLNIPLPGKSMAPLRVRFFPEGGDLALGLTNRVGWEAVNDAGQPVSIQGVLFEDDLPIDTPTTNTSGLGSFRVTPLEGKRYSLKIAKGLTSPIDTSCLLPTARPAIPALSILQAATGDTLTIRLRAPVASTYQLLLHNTQKVFANVAVTGSPAGRTVKFILSDVPKGLAAVTVFDGHRVPVAERLFFAHYSPQDGASIITDKPVYGTREKITMKLRLRNSGVDVKGSAIVSVACVQGNRVETAKFQDIESYAYLAHEIGKLPFSASSKPYREAETLERLLLVRGWRRFTWTDADTSAADTAEWKSLEISGQLMNGKKPWNRQTSLAVLRDTLASVMLTDKAGVFRLNPEEMVVSADKKMLLSIVSKFVLPLRPKIADPYLALTDSLAKALGPESPAMGLKETSTLQQRYTGGDQPRLLNVVDLKAEKDDSLFGTGFVRGPNPCGDYVCLNNILNCKNHPNGPYNYGPEIGKTYASPMGSVLYRGCIIQLKPETKFFPVKARYVSREFYVNDYTVDKDPAQMRSTVFWKPMVLLTSDADTEISFYTSDLKSDYRVIVQGAGQSGVLSAYGSFKVQ